MTNRIKKLLKANEPEATKATASVWFGDGPEGRPRSLSVRVDVLLSALTGFQLIDDHDLPLMIRVIEFISNDSIACRHTSRSDILEAAGQKAVEFTSWIEVENPVLSNIGKPTMENWEAWLIDIEGRIGGKEIVVRPMPIEYCGWVPPTEIFA